MHRDARLATPRDLVVGARTEWPTVALVTAVGAAHAAALAAAAHGHPGVGLAVGAAAAWGAFTCLHEASHGNLGRARWLSALAGELAAHVLMVRFLAFRQLHQRHHRFTNDSTRDPDRYTGRGPAWARAFFLATTDLHYYVEYDARALKCSRVESALSWASVARALALSIFVVGRFGVAAWLLGWVAPARLGLFAAAYFADYLPHGRPSAPSRAIEVVGHTRLVELGRVGELVALGHAQHLLHHLWPRVPFYRLPALARERREALDAAGAVRVDALGRARGPGRARAPEVTARADAA